MCLTFRGWILSLFGVGGGAYTSLFFSENKSETRVTASVLKAGTHKRFKRTLFIWTKRSMPIFGVTLFIKLQNDT